MNKNIINKKSKIPYIFFIFFAVIFIADGYFIYLAKSTFRGDIVKSQSFARFNYRPIIDLATKQEDLQWRVKINTNIVSDNSKSQQKQIWQPIYKLKLSIEVQKMVENIYQKVKISKVIINTYNKSKPNLARQYDFLDSDLLQSAPLALDLELATGGRWQIFVTIFDNENRKYQELVNVVAK